MTDIFRSGYNIFINLKKELKMEYLISFGNHNTSKHFKNKRFDNHQEAIEFYKNLAGGFKSNIDILVCIDNADEVEFLPLYKGNNIFKY